MDRSEALGFSQQLGQAQEEMKWANAQLLRVKGPTPTNMISPSRERQRFRSHEHLETRVTITWLQ